MVFVKRVTRFVDLAAYAADWHRLAAGDPFISWDWLSAWWNHYGADRELYVLVVTDDQHNVIGIAPWFVKSSATRGRRIRFLGSGHVCSDYVRILACAADINRVAAALATWLKEANEKTHPAEDGWDFLSLDGVRKGELSLNALRRELEANGHRSDDDATPDCWRNILGESWQEYLYRLSKRTRRKVRETRKKYIDAGRTEFEFAQDRQQFVEFYETFVALHQRRREDVGDPGCFASPHFAGFLRDAAGLFFRRGQLLLSRLLIDGDVAACSFGILSHGVHYMYQTGMNPDLGHCSPGWVMNVHNILHGQANNILAIDYLRGDEAYKARIGAERIQMAKLRVVANQTSAKVRNKLWQMRSSIRQHGLPSLGFQWGESGRHEPTG